MTPGGFLAAGLLLLGIASASGLSNRPWAAKSSSWLTAVASLLVAGAAIAVLVRESTVSIDLLSPAPYADMALALDPLGTVFCLIIAAVAVAASAFGAEYAHPNRLEAAVYPLFVLSMILVTAAANVFTFLLAWEGMALTSFLLVLGDGASRPRRHAAVLYLGMTHLATAFAAASFFLVAHEAGSSEFEAMARGPQLSGGLASLAFVFAILGFGTKAGLMPFHIWLPRAHPVAPSHVSALMSAAMVKTGIYGMVRVGFVFLGPGAAWWGITLIVAGSASAVLAILYALMEHDFKRILAYSTVENVGIITVALGAALVFRAHGLDAAASAALLAGLLHSLNHAAFKSLLFLAAGSVQRSAHVLNIDRCGGLLRTMPATGVAVLAGSLAIAALPPFNGFAGEWMLLRSLVFLAGSDVDTFAALSALAAIGALALVGGLAVACFVRLFGITFLGVPRSPEAANARESHPVMYGTLIALALACTVGGVAAPYLAQLLDPAARLVAGPSGAALESGHLLSPSVGGSLSPATLAFALALAAPLPWLILRLTFGHTRTTAGPVWATGVAFRPTMQYTGTSFGKPVRMFFRRVLLPEREVHVAYHGSSPLPRIVRYSGRVPAVFEERLYFPARRAAVGLAGRIRLLQNGSVQVYLLYVMAALVTLLVIAR